jgi:hypothetical protein
MIKDIIIYKNDGLTDACSAGNSRLPDFPKTMTTIEAQRPCHLIVQPDRDSAKYHVMQSCRPQPSQGVSQTSALSPSTINRADRNRRRRTVMKSRRASFFVISFLFSTISSVALPDVFCQRWDAGRCSGWSNGSICQRWDAGRCSAWSNGSVCQGWEAGSCVKWSNGAVCRGWEAGSCVKWSNGAVCRGWEAGSCVKWSKAFW